MGTGLYVHSNIDNVWPYSTKCTDADGAPIARQAGERGRECRRQQGSSRQAGGRALSRYDRLPHTYKVTAICAEGKLRTPAACEFSLDDFDRTQFGLNPVHPMSRAERPGSRRTPWYEANNRRGCLVTVNTSENKPRASIATPTVAAVARQPRLTRAYSCADWKEFGTAMFGRPQASSQAALENGHNDDKTIARGRKRYTN